MKKLNISFVNLFFFSFLISAQKIPLDNIAYDIWNNISGQMISEDGKWVSYAVNPQEGDGWLYIYGITSGKKDSVTGGSRAVFSSGSRYIAYQISPAFAQTRQAKKKKLKEDKMPKNDLEIRILLTSETLRIPRVKSFSVPEKDSDWMAYLMEKSTSEKKDDNASSDSSKIIKTRIEKKARTPESKGTELVIYNPLVKREYKYSDVTEFTVAKDGKSITFLQSIPDTSKNENVRITVFDTQKETIKIIFESKGTVKKLSTDKIGGVISFIYSSDTSRLKVYNLWLSENFNTASKIVDELNPGMPAQWSVSENGNITFSDDATRIYFGTAKKPVKQPEDTLLEEEKYKLDIWSWDDDLLQPMQKKQLDQELKRTWQAVYHIDRSVMFQLADTTIPSVRTFQKGNNPIALGISDLRYRKSSSWNGGASGDYYLVNIETGTKSLLLEKCSSRASLSPSAKFLIYWDNGDKGWISIPVAGGIGKNLTSSINVPLYDELNDVPDDPSPHGIAGWLDDEKHVLVYDRYDIWSLDLNGIEPPVNITNSFGRNNNLRFRYSKLDPDADFIIRKDPVYLSAFKYDNKEAGYYILKPGKVTDPLKLIMDKVTFSGDFIKAKNADLLLWQKGSYTNSPELFISNMNFTGVTRLSNTNPQQQRYIWGTAELVEWLSFERKQIQGILYKPEDFDPSKKYPMIVYFYERSSDGLYNYISPVPSASRINITFAVSNGYLVFVPDIPYVTGYPGQSCYNSVVSGTYALLDRFKFIDKDRLGLDGQSWGGYQIAYLVTKTDLYACAYAGAAVSNMISAYGGIRWESGMSRMFQYEHTQSRIGGTLWDKPFHFIENSPIFFVPKINTPLLLMNNDADGAVPWYQGIEFITALRRLEKPAWMLTYNDEAHNLVKRANRKDISIRKMQFFDHYLKGVQMPYWMKNGISQIEKGKIDGFNLVNE